MLLIYRRVYIAQLIPVDTIRVSIAWLTLLVKFNSTMIIVVICFYISSSTELEEVTDTENPDLGSDMD